MIETEQSVVIDVGIDAVWTHVRDIERWAKLMPGLRECRIIDADRSHWVLKVGAGGLVRTVNVNVHVTEWGGPGRVTFTYDLEGDPVQGGGTYIARAVRSGETEVTLRVEVVGSGQMAKMWEAMGKPLLPQFAKAFAQQLKAEIEAEAENAGIVATEAARPSWPARLVRFVRSLFGMSGTDTAIERR
ncbi:polyketide cyclase/dehydrase/lipid transport protein [Novosphingobium sp. PhB165]|uniref:CoxG family protein n=1 Tax=Novosphingobium sp. PhB165 TaxID=2485105 RepID=UPI00104A69C2|nr:SRPBCC family protein [Novosphingobium sp. PhB165]TCM15344.1 polyketide cyclase/dehydrase/lipid transport protein [Novosphingobium sp. PhB165]